MEDDVDAYLRLANKLRWKHFPKGHSSVAQQKHAGGCEAAAEESRPTQSTTARLPMKKRKRTYDSDSDSETGASCVVDSGAAASGMPSTAPFAALSKGHTPARVTLMEKWFPGSTLRNATLDAAQAPPLDYTELSVARMNAARERLLSLRSGVEDVMQCAKMSSGNKDINNYAAPVGNTAVVDSTGWNWLGLRDALSQITLCDSLRRKKRVESSVQWLLSTRLDADVPREPALRQWECYLNRKGPEQGYEPPLSLLVWLDGACTAALFTALVNRMLRVHKSGMKPAAFSRNDTRVHKEEEEEENGAGCERSDDDDDEQDSVQSPETKGAEGGERKQKQSAWSADNSEPIILSARLPPLYGGGETEEVISLLSFLRALMPVDIVDGSDNVVGHSVGYGVWLYACLTALDIPLDPDLDRLVHDLFSTCCRQIRTLGERYGIRGDTRGDILRAFSPRSRDATSRREYNVLSDVRREDVLALHTIIIVLAKLFRQNQNRLIPF